MKELALSNRMKVFNKILSTFDQMDFVSFGEAAKL